MKELQIEIMLEQTFKLSPMVLILDKLNGRLRVDHFDSKYYCELDLRECVHRLSLVINSLQCANSFWLKLFSCTSVFDSPFGANLSLDCVNVR